jgi:hypothetical protein
MFREKIWCWSYLWLVARFEVRSGPICYRPGSIASASRLPRENPTIKAWASFRIGDGGMMIGDWPATDRQPAA